MKFITLEILNLASLDRQGGEVINFEEGALAGSTIFSIVGPTGSGKSTILDAICLALYNRAPRYPRRRGDRNQKIEIFGEPEEGERNRLAPTDSRNILTRGKKEGYSKLTFLANNGDVYRAEWSVRKLTRNYEDARTSLYKLSHVNGETTEEQAEWADLPQIIGLDYEQFLRTVLIAQGSFAGFLTAKEDQRYELLEKLIGCEELYTSIAVRIKQRKDEAVEAYNQIAANVSAQEKDILSEEELNALGELIRKLEEEERKAKEELERVMEGIRWYSTNKTFDTNIANYKTAFDNAKQQLEAIREQTDRLALHDATHPALDLYKGIRASEEKIGKHDEKLQQLSDDMEAKEQRIKQEEETNLARLKEDLQRATDELECQRPHINRARGIKAELEGLKKTRDEKDEAKRRAEEAQHRADKEAADNRHAIEEAGTVLNKAEQALSHLMDEIKKEELDLKQKADDAVGKYNVENDKLKGVDAEQLARAKSSADQTLNDLRDAIRIQGDIKKKKESKESEASQQKQLSERNEAIAKELGGFEIETLSSEIDTLGKSYTLMTSENWEQHRARLVEGEACPLCGGTHHPYHNPEVVTPVIDGMKKLIEEKTKALHQQRESKQALTKEQSENNGRLNGLEKTLKELDDEISRLCSQWSDVHQKHEDWPEDAEALRASLPRAEQDVRNADEKLTAYKKLVKVVEELYGAKEAANKQWQEFIEGKQRRIQEAEEKRTNANTQLKIEKGKTANLLAQQKEKQHTLEEADHALRNANEDVLKKTEALRNEIGERDPDAYEKELETKKNGAWEKVNAKSEEIARLREELKKLSGEKEGITKQRHQESSALTDRRSQLTDWMTAYTEQHEQPLTEELLLSLYAATDHWEEIRETQKRLNEAYTAASTTLRNEQKAHEAHQEKRPGLPEEELKARKAELDGRLNRELIESQARLRRHETAAQLLGAMLSQKQEAAARKQDWEEIADAIGSDGKTLRKLAQCYTLRFLIEHANAEIRKFNSRYELQQVRNSLGIRVIDHHRADDVRDTTSLSGGETFIVSLGLALGLSALSSRNIRFDNLFIDEGFGTLDPDTLAVVIDSLAMLQSSQGKKVGVISHTDTMRERITTQIRIVKNGNSGSSHIELYP